MSAEIELKLEMDPHSLAHLRRSPVIAKHRTGRAVTRHLSNTYYDTPDLTLSASETVLRIRKAGSTRVQTVKVGAGVKGAHFDRAEWEVPVPGDRPNAEALIGTPLAARFPDEGALAVLQPTVRTEFKRTTWLLADTDWEIELSLDDGKTTAGPDSVPICEAELELKRGEPHHLFDLASRLSDGIALRIGLRSKAEKGFDLLLRRTPQPLKASSPTLKRKGTCADALRRIGTDCLHQLLVNAECLNARPQPEAVHQMRVAMRRLRSAMTLFRSLIAGQQSESLVAEIKWATGMLGEARDLDVFLSEVIGPVRAAFPLDDGLIALEKEISDRRQTAYRQATEAVTSPRFAQLTLNIAAWLEDGMWLHPTDPVQASALARPLMTFAAETLDARKAKVRKRGRHFATLDAEHRHAVRIDVKKLRYAVEFFGSLWPRKKRTSFSKALASLQESLGSLNDIAVAHTLLQAWSRDFGSSTPQTMRGRAFAAGVVAGWHEHGSDAHLQKAVAAWKIFTDTKPFWRC